MVSVLQYPFLTPYGVATHIISANAHCNDVIYSPLFQWLLNGKIAENPVVTPTAEKQIIRPTSVNRYLESVIVEPIPTTTTTP